jgi:hypothetical protein
MKPVKYIYTVIVINGCKYPFLEKEPKKSKSEGGKMKSGRQQYFK